jgi:hypothetical protein
VRARLDWHGIHVALPDCLATLLDGLDFVDEEIVLGPETVPEDPEGALMVALEASPSRPTRDISRCSHFGRRIADGAV